jgi:hypothetical protein
LLSDYIRNYQVVGGLKETEGGVGEENEWRVGLLIFYDMAMYLNNWFG